jgi:hypothetical protein
MIEVLKQALDALVVEQYAVKLFNLVPKPHITKAIASLNQAIAELESQEPVAWKHPDKNMVFWEDTKEVDEYHGFKPTIPLYTHPPQRTEPKVCCQQYDTCLEPCTPRGTHLAQRTWVDLTQQEIDELDEQSPSLHDFVQNLMSKIKEKNT